MSEKSIINALLVVCLTLGFVCVATIYLPSKVAGNRAPTSFNPSRLLALLPDENKSEIPNTPPPPAPSNNGTYAQFTPETEPPTPFAAAQAAPSDPPQGSQDESASIFARMHKQSSLSVYDRSKEKPTPFKVPPELENEVAFWRDVYAKYDSHQVVLHDMKYLTIVYGVLDFTELDKDTTITAIERERTKQARIDAEKEQITAILDELTKNPRASELSDRALAIRDMFGVVNEGDKFKKAKERGVRAQLGQRDKFIAGLQYSGRYLGEIESIFEAQGLPRDLTFLIFVESMFNPEANSSAGAKGVWQFMKSTGKIYGLKQNPVMDERADPIRSTYAAAGLLKHDYENLGSWPLAINAYNTGRGRIDQAVARLGTTDISRIVKNFEHPSYGFAARNFYVEFLAAMDVAKSYMRYFGNIKFDHPLSYDLIQTNKTISLPQIAVSSRIPVEAIAELNPKYTSAVLSGRISLPRGSELRLPEKQGTSFLAHCNDAPQKFPLTHIVEAGETIQDIAASYNIPVVNLLKANNLAGKRLRVGQELKITR